MTQLRLLLSLLALFLSLNSFAHHCECYAKVHIDSLEKQGNQLLIHYTIKGDLTYHIKKVTVFNRSQDQTIEVISISGDNTNLKPNTPYTLRWDVLVDVPIIENIQKQDFLIELYLTTQACKYAKRWRNMSFGTMAVPLTGFTFGNKTRSRGLGMSYELGIWLDKKLGNNGVFGLDLYFAQYGFGLDRANDVLFQGESVDVKNARMRLRSLNIAPSIKWKIGNSQPFFGINIGAHVSGKVKFRADGERYKEQVFDNNVVFPTGSFASQINQANIGWFLGMEWYDEKRNAVVFWKYGGQLVDLVWHSYWAGSSGNDESENVLGLLNNELRYTYLSFGIRWQLSQNLVKYKG